MNEPFADENPERFAAAIRRFDEVNSQDPHRETNDGKEIPRELLYAQRLTEWVLRLQPNASEPLRLAARSAHLRRWAIPRESYPATRAGYLLWRADLKKYHAQTAGEILRELGYPLATISQVLSLISKSSFPNTVESRALEDALCLLFLERQFADLAKKSSDEKVINALQKTWKKMTPAARAIALKLPYGPHETMLLKRALQQPGAASN